MPKYNCTTTKEEICAQFVNICENGTSKDCRIFVQEAKQKGVSYEELVAYKRNKNEI